MIKAYLQPQPEDPSVVQVDGLTPEQTGALQTFVRSHVTLTSARAKFHLSGHSKGYKGQDTQFGRCGDDLPELVVEKKDKADKPEAEAKPCDRANWDSYYEQAPADDDIDYDDFLKYGTLSAKVYGDVWVVSVTKQ
jgi:hypothetical protein